MTDLTEAQVRCLRRLAAGERIYFSRDGEMARLSRAVKGEFLDDVNIWALRDAGYLVREEDPDDDSGRGGPHDWDAISPAGRAYLAALDEPARPQAGGEGDGE